MNERVTAAPSKRAAKTVVGRYVLHAPIARGGMATIHLARMLGSEGFSRMVAAKRLHPELSEDADLVAMLLDEARIASKIHHPNVVPVLDVVRSEGEVILVQEYVHGVPLDKLLRAAREARELLPVGVVIAIAADMLTGLAAAHDAKDELGASLGIVHRDVSPQNVMVGVDGIARLLDFGVAKASVNAHVTRAGMFKGKLAYTAPEQLRGEVTTAIDVYASAVVAWEALAGRRLHPGLRELELVAAVTRGDVARLCSVVDRESISSERWGSLTRLEPLLARAMSLAPEDRFGSAGELRDALLAEAPAATAAEVSQWVKRLGKEYLEGRERLIVAEESTWRQRASAVPEAEASRADGDEAGSLRASAIPVDLVAKRRPMTALLTVVAMGVALLALLVASLRRPAEPAVTIAAAASPPPVASPPASSAPPAPPSPAPTASASAASAASHLAAPRVVVRPRPLASPASPRVDKPRSAVVGHAGDACNPPFYFRGTKKVFKPGCL
jgi:eukaryotic-like serine/threonine-protein kinase